MNSLNSNNLSELMNDVDKCKVLIELLENSYGDNDWKLAQTLSVIKDILTPVIAGLIDVVDDLMEQEDKDKPVLSKVA
ncbi:hypothetical protein [Moraxella catarrhalis]|uniref:hypothetical protein n=1 Tax=Moraxella catarrhalis TaxID=480 RepID=UPI000720B5C3|nr:hypothetical protein [Moraxella catarrhalis]AKI27142.1 hypothetical protein [Moraxella phage Mcat4]MPX87371.1 hypothetical protein [Moraxella catarrhalis]